MSEQYFSRQPNSKQLEKYFEQVVHKKKYKFITDNGVFSKERVDFGSIVLIESILNDLNNSPIHNFIELGSGYGPISIVLADQFNNSNHYAVEINERAYNLAIRNAKLNSVNNIQWILSDVYDVDLSVKANVIYTNPPIRAGKKVIQGFVDIAYQNLDVEGSFYVVIQKKQGAPSMKEYMNIIFGNVERIALEKGYWVLKSKKQY